jgi:hypothetical protein
MEWDDGIPVKVEKFSLLTDVQAKNDRNAILPSVPQVELSFAVIFSNNGLILYHG